jgi:predicted alpha-1,2-mannosidase
MAIFRVFFFCILFAGALSSQTQPIQFVNPFIGTAAHGHTYPGATAPFGLVQLSPDTRPSMMDWDGCSAYHYSDSLIYGFSHTHLSGTGVPDYGDILFVPYTDKPFLENIDNASPFKKENETATAGYYSVFLEKDRIMAELTATERVGVHRYTYPVNKEQMHLMVDLRHRDEVLGSELSIINDHEIAGHRISRAWAREQHVYFVARFSQAFFNTKVLDMTKSPHVSDQSVNSKAILGLLDFYQYNTPLVVTVGISGVSIEAARKNLEAECNHFNFDQVKKETQAKWSAQLGKIEVEGGNKAQKTAFYSALYHTMIVPNVWSDVDGQYRGRDGKIHQADGHQMYTVFSLWDTYRACNPLYTLLEPDRTRDFIHTFLRQYEQGGLLPMWELSANETDCMIGNHAIPVIADAYLKGIRGYDAEKALEAMIKSADYDRYGLPWYRKLGYIPSDQEPESVSKTLEYAYDDWCIAQMAKALGKTAVYERFIQRAQSYKNVFDPNSGFFRGKSNGAWHQPFDPFEVNFNYTEANAWQYRFAAPQDINGMMRLLGGRKGFTAQLDSLFTAHAKTTGREQADITGLIGQYAHGNEPSHHMAYLYNYAGQPWKGQFRIRQIMDELYSDQPDGLSGNEDCGQMSAWLVFSAMGFYPVVPASGEYAFGTPLFEKTTLHLPNGKTLVIQAPGASKQKPYIQQVRCNGQNWTQNFISHDKILEGGVWEIQMGDKPSTWGSTEKDCPVTSIDEFPIVPAPFVARGERVFQNSQEIALQCIDAAADIFYTLDSTEAKSKYKKYKKPIKIEKTTHIRFYAQGKNGESALIQSDFSKLQTDIKIHRYNTRYDNQYTARGENGLIDMLRGGADFRSGGWQGYQGVDVDVVIDLGKKRDINGLSAGFLQDENSWIFFPSKVQFEVSDDGIQFQSIGEVATRISAQTLGTHQQDFILRVSNVQARYVRVHGISLGKCPAGHKGAGYPCWVFVDEVLID